MLKDILEHFPLKKYGAITFLFLFPLLCLYYYFAYYPFLETSRTFEVNCGVTNTNDEIGLSVSAPIFVQSESEINIVVANISPENLENIKITIVPDDREYSRFTNITFEPVNIDSLSVGANENYVSKLTIYGMQNDSYVSVKRIYLEINNQVAQCESVSGSHSFTLAIHNQLGSWVLSVVRTMPAALAILLFLSTISCSIIEDESQDFHPTIVVKKLI